MAVPILNNIGQGVNNLINNQGKRAGSKVNELQNMYKIIGMETYDLYKQGRLNDVNLQSYFEKVQVLENEIAMEEAAKTNAGGRKCSCGAVLSSGSKFCPACGKAVATVASIQCENCGNQLSPNAKFCNGCGTPVATSIRPVSSAEARPTQFAQPVQPVQQQFIDCICGSKVPMGQTLCMTCGRKISMT